jgi:hypothetical protein
LLDLEKRAVQLRICPALADDLPDQLDLLIGCGRFLLQVVGEALEAFRGLRL